MLGRKKTGQGSGKNPSDNIPAVAELSIRGGLVAQQSQLFPLQERGRSITDLFNTNGNHGIIRSSYSQSGLIVLFNGDAFRQVAGLIHVAATPVGNLIGQQLGGNSVEQGV